VSKKEMRKAREAEEQRIEERKRLDRERDAVLTSDLLGTLISHLQRGESILEALQRLAGSKGRQKPRWHKNRKATADEMDAETGADEAESRRKEAVDAISSAADQLLSRGHEQIYEAERELLMRQYKKETGDDWIDSADKKEDNGSDEASQWQFRWGDARDGAKLHGPYDSQTMSSWSDAGYFAGDVEFRRVGTELWSRVVDFT
jgi:CD2 antigen cytoplasmic tail-binding protein 2